MVLGSSPVAALFVINWCSMLQTTICLNSVWMCMDLQNTLERLCVQLNMANTNMLDKLLDNRTCIFTEKRISDILFEGEMGSMPSSIPNNYNHPHLRSTNTKITTQPNYWRSMVTSESFEWDFSLLKTMLHTNMFNSLLTDDTLTFYVMNSSAANCCRTVHNIEHWGTIRQ